MTILLNYHIGRIVLGSMCVGVSVWLGWSGIRVAGFTSYVLNMFRTLIYPSSGACDCAVELPHWSYCSWFDVCWSFGVVGMEWYPCCRLKHSCRLKLCFNTHRTKNNTINVAIQQNSRQLLLMDILMFETC